MKKFKIFSTNGKEGSININGINKDRIIKVEVNELKIGASIIEENTIATVSYTNRTKYPVLKFKDDRLLKLSNQNLVDYIWNENGNDRSNCLYSHTTEYKKNYLD